MSHQLAELHKLYASNKYNPTVFFMNPFTEILFLNNWVWPEEYVSHKKNPVKKPHSGGDGLKEKIKQWFINLDFESQRNCLMVKDKKFIQSLCYFLPTYNSRNVYNMKNRKCMKNIEVSEVNSTSQKGLNIILQNFQIAFLKEPIIHLSKNCQKFLSNELIKWMEIISHKKIFQYANKIKQSELLEENILWFNENSFYKLEVFIVNEFQKAVTKCYFNRDRIQSNYFSDMKQFCLLQRESLKNKNIETQLLSCTLNKAAKLSIKEIETKIAQMREIEEKYEREKQKLIQKLLDDQSQTINKEQGKKKRRRIRKKFKADEQIEPNIDIDEVLSNEKVNKTPIKENTAQKFKKGKKYQLKQFVEAPHEEEKVGEVFNDEISQISKCEDQEFHQTDVTFQKYFENEEKSMTPESECSDIVCQISNEQKKMKKSVEESSKEIDQFQGKQNNEQIMSEAMIEPNDQSGGKVNISRQKKKSKKEKIIEGLQENLVKSIRNSAFTEFIDTISIQSNNLYNYKLSAYQFIAFFISSLLPTTNITLFGSNAVGLSLASSDIDIMISNIRWSNISEVREVLYHIGNQISKMGWVVDYRLILNAKVPVLKLFIDPKIDYFDHSPLKYASQTTLMESIVIKADIIVNIEGDQNIGCESTFLMKEWLTDHPQLQRIILFFKYVLWYYGLNENYRGGICSYCLFLMVVSCLFKKVEALKSGQKSLFQVLQDEDEGTYILQILKYYSEVFDPKIDEITIQKSLKMDTGIKIKDPKEQITTPKKNLTLKIADPITGEYIESSFNKFQQIQQLFSMILVQSMKLDDQAKRFLNSRQEITEEFSKYYQSMSQGNTGYNVITKNMDQPYEFKAKKMIKKILGKLKKNDSIKYNVKEIVGVGFKIGIQNWMMSSGNNYSEQKFNI